MQDNVTKSYFVKLIYTVNPHLSEIIDSYQDVRVGLFIDGGQLFRLIFV